MIAQPITGLGSDAIPACNAVNTPYKRACRSQECQEGRDFSGSLAQAFGKPLNISSLEQ